MLRYRETQRLFSLKLLVKVRVPIFGICSWMGRRALNLHRFWKYLGIREERNLRRMVASLPTIQMNQATMKSTLKIFRVVRIDGKYQQAAECIPSGRKKAAA